MEDRLGPPPPVGPGRLSTAASRIGQDECVSGTPRRRASRAILSAAIHTIGFGVAESVVEGCEHQPELVVLVDGTPLFGADPPISGKSALSDPGFPVSLPGINPPVSSKS